jgi:hypothetical protein
MKLTLDSHLIRANQFKVMFILDLESLFVPKYLKPLIH